MSSTEEKDIEVIAMDAPSPASSTISTSSTSDSEDVSDEQETAPSANVLDRIQLQDEEMPSPLALREEMAEEEEGQLVMFRKDFPRSPDSPVVIEEERSSGMDYPLSQRVYSNPSCSISTILQRQCAELWRQFDSIGTEMIVTRRGR